jgi:DNA invertase Pin-like site-specific DNA recombinase
MFKIIAAMAEFERSLIQERVRAGLRNAKLKGKTLGRPRRIVNNDEGARLREPGGELRRDCKANGYVSRYGTHASVVWMINGILVFETKTERISSGVLVIRP